MQEEEEEEEEEEVGHSAKLFRKCNMFFSVCSTIKTVVVGQVIMSHPQH